MSRVYVFSVSGTDSSFTCWDTEEPLSSDISTELPVDTAAVACDAAMSTAIAIAEAFLL